MRIITAKGEIRKVTGVVPYAECGFTFNGVRRQTFDQAKDLSYATGIVIHTEASGSCMSFGMAMSAGEDFVVGNLPNETVQEIIRDLAEEGFYDFSKFHYSNKISVSDIELDGGQSMPYCNDFTIIAPISMGLSGCSRGLFNGFSPSINSRDDEFEDPELEVPEEDDDSEDDNDWEE